MSQSSERIQFVFENVNNWLRFAEAKNGALIVVNITIAVALIQTLSGITSGTMTSYIVFCMGLLVLSTLLCIASFFPKIRLPDIVVPTDPTSVDTSVLYFGHIKDVCPDDYLKKLIGAGVIETEDASSLYYRDLACQTVVNAKIAHRKYEFFQVATIVTVGAIASPIAALAFWIIIHENS
jgi:hypothetical protein